MFFEAEFLDTIVRALALSSVALVWIVVVVRVVGLRAFSKMTAFDFVVTVATGSLLAGAAQASSWPAFFQATLAMAGLLGVQYATAWLRKSSERFEAVVQNAPVLLMRDGDPLSRLAVGVHARSGPVPRTSRGSAGRGVRMGAVGAGDLGIGRAGSARDRRLSPASGKRPAGRR
jgi:hypothetical protein